MEALQAPFDKVYPDAQAEQAVEVQAVQELAQAVQAVPVE